MKLIKKKNKRTKKPVDNVSQFKLVLLLEILRINFPLFFCHLNFSLYCLSNKIKMFTHFRGLRVSRFMSAFWATQKMISIFFKCLFPSRRWMCRKKVFLFEQLFPHKFNGIVSVLIQLLNWSKVNYSIDLIIEKGEKLWEKEMKQAKRDKAFTCFFQSDSDIRSTVGWPMRN